MICTLITDSFTGDIGTSLIYWATFDRSGKKLHTVDCVLQRDKCSDVSSEMCDGDLTCSRKFI